MTKIKICGLFRPEDIMAVNEARPDYIGFVFAKSRRQVSREEAEKLKKLLRPDITAAGVFVDSPIEFIENIVKDGSIDMIQLHGRENQDYIKELKKRTGREIIKAFKVTSPEDIKDAVKTPADYLLFDSGEGTGKTFDWNMIKEKIDIPFFLAGGIHAGIVEEAITALHPYALDVSSAAESGGVKNKEKILEIVRRIRNV